GWGDFSDYGEGGRWVEGGAYAGEVGGSSGVESDWGGTAEDTASLSDGSLDPVGQQPDSSPTAYAEYTGVHPDYVRDYYQSQFSNPTTADTADSNAPTGTDDQTDPVTSSLNDPIDDGLITGQGPDEFKGGVIDVPVNPTDTQWDVVVRSLHSFAQAASLPSEEEQSFVDHWSEVLKQNNETGLYHYDSNGKTPFSDEEFAKGLSDQKFSSELSPDMQPEIVQDLRDRQAAVGCVSRCELVRRIDGLPSH